MAVITQGELKLALKFEKFPAAAHAKLEQRMNRIVEMLRARVREEAPVKTGKLRSEISGRVFADSKERIAGYVDVYAPGAPTEYPKAATLEYGSDKPRREFEKTGRLGALLERAGGRTKRIALRLSSAPVHIRAFRYLRGSIEDMRPQIEAELAAALAEATAEE